MSGAVSKGDPQRLHGFCRAPDRKLGDRKIARDRSARLKYALPSRESVRRPGKWGLAATPAPITLWSWCHSALTDVPTYPSRRYHVADAPPGAGLLSQSPEPP